MNDGTSTSNSANSIDLRGDQSAASVRIVALIAGIAGSAGLGLTGPAVAQDTLPEVTVEGTAASAPRARATVAENTDADEAVEPGSLTVPTSAEALQLIDRTPGGVEVVPNTVWEDKPATTLKDVLEYTPGVFIQPKWGQDARLSIRGSGLSRNFHLRGIQLYTDGIPVSLSDGSGDFQEIDPTAFSYTEVYKGANALRYGANALGGAINFVSPTGYDADLIQGRADIGSFGMRLLQASSGGVEGAFDAFVTGSLLEQDGFREHSGGDSFRGSGNVGVRLSDDIETRFFFAVANIQQDIPGAVTRETALTTPKAPLFGNLAFGFGNVVQDWERNIESMRIANRTVIDFDGASLELGAYAVGKHLMHPIFQWIDYQYNDFGSYARFDGEGEIMGHDNRLLLGVNSGLGWIDNAQFANLPGGVKGRLLSKSKDRSTNTVLYGENAFEVVPNHLPDLYLVTGLQYVHTTRNREDLWPALPNTSGKEAYDFLNPKVGLLWDVDPNWQIFGNISRSGEAPTFSDLNFTNQALSDTNAQKATTYEIGTRGARETVTWDVALYRMSLTDELQFFDLGGGNYQVVNADDTMHQGIEAGLGLALWSGILRNGDEPDRLWLNTAYTLNDFRFENDPLWGDNELPGAPRHFIRTELLYKHPDGFFAGPNIEWVPESYFVDNANSLETASYALLGARAGIDFGEHFSLWFDGRNLTDEIYIASASITGVATINSTLFEPGAGRSYYAGMNARW